MKVTSQPRFRFFTNSYSLSVKFAHVEMMLNIVVV